MVVFASRAALAAVLALAVAPAFASGTWVQQGQGQGQRQTQMPQGHPGFEKQAGGGGWIQPEAYEGPRAESLSGDQAEEVSEFIAGNVLFILYHEFGHAMVDNFDLPVLGKEEDAVDNLATVLLAPEPGDPDEVLLGLTLAAADGWFMSDAVSELGRDELPFWGVHGLDLQRAYAIVCLMAGANPDAFAQTAVEWGLPEDRVESCPDDYEQVRTSWERVLEPHVLGENEQPNTVVTVRWGEIDANSGDAIDIVREMGLVELVAEIMTTSFRWPQDIELVVESCGEENAYYSPSDKRVTLCTEIVGFYRDLILQDIASR